MKSFFSYSFNVFLQTYTMTSFTTLAIDMQIIKDNQFRIYLPVSPISSPPKPKPHTIGGDNQFPIYLPVSPDSSPPKPRTLTHTLTHVSPSLTNLGNQDDSNDEDEEDMPYDIRWGDELARRSRRRQPPQVKVNITNYDYYDDMVFPIFD